jgi:hypothetical protein
MKENLPIEKLETQVELKEQKTLAEELEKAQSTARALENSVESLCNSLNDLDKYYSLAQESRELERVLEQSVKELRSIIANEFPNVTKWDLALASVLELLNVNRVGTGLVGQMIYANRKKEDFKELANKFDSLIYKSQMAKGWARNYVYKREYDFEHEVWSGKKEYDRISTQLSSITRDIKEVEDIIKNPENYMSLEDQIMGKKIVFNIPEILKKYGVEGHISGPFPEIMGEIKDSLIEKKIQLEKQRDKEFRDYLKTESK